MIRTLRSIRAPFFQAICLPVHRSTSPSPAVAAGSRTVREYEVIRLFNHYLNRRVLLQVILDFGLIVALIRRRRVAAA